MGKDLQDNRINVDFGVVVTIPIASYNLLREAHTDKERYAQQIHEHELNLADAQWMLKNSELLVQQRDQDIEVLKEEVTKLLQDIAALRTGPKVSKAPKDKESTAKATGGKSKR